jgi:tannase/feruloyl esterase/hemolysin type calcium-binding protein/3HB-oligomer hydrolase 3HBOH
MPRGLAKLGGYALRCRVVVGACAALLCGMVLALVVLVAGVPGSAGADEGVDTGSDPGVSCVKQPSQVPNLVPQAEVQDPDCLSDLTTAHTQETGHTNKQDWDGLHAEGTNNPSGVPGLQVDGYFRDDSHTNSNNGWFHDSQFVIRFPNDWNGKLVITGAPGVRAQYANDFIISDWVLAQGYAFASTDKGNTGTAFYNDRSAPGGSVLEWHRRVEQLTKAAKTAAERYYPKALTRTYITGISNGGYLTRYALENNPELYDGGVDWEGTLFRAHGPNLFTYLPVALRNYPLYEATGSREAHNDMIRAGFQPGSEFLWDEHYVIYWDLTQRIYREEFDPKYDGPLKAGIPFCQPGTPNCDANYVYRERPQRVKDAVRKVSLTGDIGKPLLTLHGDLDALLPIRTDSDVYTRLVRQQGHGDIHRYYVIGKGNHVDSFYDDYPQRLRPILPCHRDAFKALEDFVERDVRPPDSGYVPKPENGDVVNRCSIENTAPRPDPEPDPSDPDNPGSGPECTITGTQGNDELAGTSRDDVICGLGGDDEIHGNGGDDTIRGDSGNDALNGGSSNDTVIGGTGNDELSGVDGDDRLNARDEVRGNDDADGGTGRDTCTTDPGDSVSSCQ